MRITVSAEQLKFYNIHGYLELEDLISKEEANQLLSFLTTMRDKSPGYDAENCFRSIPFIAALARRKGWGQIAAVLLHKKPLRLAYDHFWSKKPEFQHELDQDSCGLLLNLTSGHGIFFKQFIAYPLKHDSQNNYLIVILTAKNLPETLNPLIIR